MAMLSLGAPTQHRKVLGGPGFPGTHSRHNWKTSRESYPPEHGSAQYFFSMFLEELLLASQQVSLG